ncbi:MAG: DUF7391 family protein [Thermomicrobiales bacterium]|jgi:hypothetical protein
MPKSNPKVRRGSASDFRARRNRQPDDVFEFVLENTRDGDGNPLSVMARIPNFEDIDALSKLPNTLQAAMFEMLEKLQGAQQEIDETGAGADDAAAISRFAMENLGNMVASANAWVIMGFVEPKVYLDLDEADAKDGVWINDIEFPDRLAFMNLAHGNHQEASQKVVPFRSGQNGDVRAGSAGAAVPGSGEPEPGDPAQAAAQ